MQLNAQNITCAGKSWNKFGGSSMSQTELGQILAEVYRVVLDRKVDMPEGSYTTYLYTKGQDKILKKVGEEAAEVIIGSKNNSKEEVVYEVSDLLYHLLVLLGYHEIPLEDIALELANRHKK
jgi:phosphoribosyl-ATP pyrophosphohydrolase